MVLPESYMTLVLFAVNPCRDSLCQNGGQCSILNDDEAACICSVGWTGKFCESGSDMFIVLIFTYLLVKFDAEHVCSIAK